MNCLPILLITSCLMLHGQSIQILQTFDGSNGAVPAGSLILVNGTLYGFTSVGGASSAGSVFRIQTNGSGFENLYSFPAGANNGVGTNPKHNYFAFIAPTLYGSTENGGSNDNGSLYKINIDGTSFAPIHVFSGAVNDGSTANSCPISFNGLLYGCTRFGGTMGEGTLYQIAPDGTNFSVLYSFDSPTGSQSHGQLLPSSDGTQFFGITRKGGANDFGVIFSYAPFTTSYNILHDFGSIPNDGETAEHGSLIRPFGSTLYGMTSKGGLASKGVIFRIDESGGGYEILHNFGQLADGQSPYGSLTYSPYGILYGMTRNGGDNDVGTIFQILPEGDGYQILFSFDDQLGSLPIDNVTLSVNNLVLYGLAQFGGLANNGSIFSFQLPAGSFPPAIQALLQFDSTHTSLRSFNFLATNNLQQQQAVLIERQSIYRRAKTPRSRNNKELGQLVASIDPVYIPHRDTRTELFQKKINFALFDSYQLTDIQKSQGIDGMKVSSNGISFLSDVRVGRHVFLGTAIGYLSATSRFNNSLGHINLQSIILSPYLSLNWHRFYTDIIGSYAWNTYDQKRFISAFDLTAKSHPTGYLGAASLTTGYWIDYGRLALTPIGGLFYARSIVQPYQEKEADVFNMAVPLQTIDSLHSKLALRLGTEFGKPKQSVRLLVEGEAGWEYEMLESARTVAANLIAASFPFDIALPGGNRNFFTWRANLTCFLSSHCYIGFSYNGQYSPNTILSNAFTGNVNLSF